MSSSKDFTICRLIENPHNFAFGLMLEVIVITLIVIRGEDIMKRCESKICDKL
jgi:hypothetical protein